MKDGYNIVEFFNICKDEENPRMVLSVDYNVIAYLGNTLSDNKIVNSCCDRGLEDSELMVVEVKDGEVIDCVNMVFFHSIGDCFIDCCEWDFRIHASVAFDKDLV